MAKFLNKSSDEFGTPQDLWLPLHEEFKFTIDAAASKDNALLKRYWTKEQDALKQCWDNERVFCNPPYSRGNVERFFHKCRSETRGFMCQLAVLLIPTYTERTWFHNYRSEFECRFVQGRRKFVGGETSARGNHMILVFRNKNWAWWSY